MLSLFLVTCGIKLYYAGEVIKQVCLLRCWVQGGSLLLTCTPFQQAARYLLYKVTHRFPSIQNLLPLAPLQDVLFISLGSYLKLWFIFAYISSLCYLVSVILKHLLVNVEPFLIVHSKRVEPTGLVLIYISMIPGQGDPPSLGWGPFE